MTNVDALPALVDLVTALLDERAVRDCRCCQGKRTVSIRRGPPYETYTAEERAACWEDVPCPGCRPIIARVDAALARMGEVGRNA